MERYTVGPLRVLHPWIQPRTKNIQEKEEQKSKNNKNLKIEYNTYLHSIYIVLGIISNGDDLKYRHTSKILQVWLQTTALK
uniref:Uncharacterized protein n=1 Tax=Macaca fascicularis TaxID=9541 RepID=I7GCQ3_MACFA|nr:unnamed protein product [Macaca fascicularis]